MIELERTIHCKSIIKIQHDYRHRAVETGLHPRQSSLASDSHSRRRATPPKRLRRLWILSAISLAGKTIANKVRRAGLEDVLGEHGDSSNVHGEKQQKLDLIANEILLRCLGNRPSVALVASEEDNDPHHSPGNEGGKYCVIFDPLDGSSNLDVCVEWGRSSRFATTRIFRRHGDCVSARPHAGRRGLHFMVRVLSLCSPPATALTCSCSINPSGRSCS